MQEHDIVSNFVQLLQSKIKHELFEMKTLLRNNNETTRLKLNVRIAFRNIRTLLSTM